MSDPKMSKTTPNAISSQESEDGVSPLDSQDGQMTGLFGQDLAPANLSPLQVAATVRVTKDTSGHPFSWPLKSAALQSSLVSKLLARMDVHGSPEYALTWTHWAMPLGGPICALRASVRHTSDSDYGGWPTPMAGTPAQNGNNAAGNNDSSRTTVRMAGWLTPKCPSGGGQASRTTPGGGLRKLEDQVVSVPHVPTEKADSGRLNPRFSLWLMGYPTDWASCGERVTR